MSQSPRARAAAFFTGRVPVKVPASITGTAPVRSGPPYGPDRADRPRWQDRTPRHHATLTAAAAVKTSALLAEETVRRAWPSSGGGAGRRCRASSTARLRSHRAARGDHEPTVDGVAVVVTVHAPYCGAEIDYVDGSGSGFASRTRTSRRPADAGTRSRSTTRRVSRPTAPRAAAPAAPTSTSLRSRTFTEASERERIRASFGHPRPRRP